MPSSILPELSIYSYGGTCYTLSDTTKRYEDNLFTYTCSFSSSLGVQKYVATDNSYMIYAYTTPTGYMRAPEGEISSYILRTFYGKLSLDGAGSISAKTIYFKKFTLDPTDPPSPSESYTLSVMINAYRLTAQIGLNESTADGFIVNLSLTQGSTDKSLGAFSFLESLSLKFTIRATYDKFDSTLVLPFTSFDIDAGYDNNLADSEYLLYSENIRPSRWRGTNIQYNMFHSTEVTWLAGMVGIIKLKLGNGTSILASVRYA